MWNAWKRCPLNVTATSCSQPISCLHSEITYFTGTKSSAMLNLLRTMFYTLKHSGNNVDMFPSYENISFKTIFTVKLRKIIPNHWWRRDFISVNSPLTSDGSTVFFICLLILNFDIIFKTARNSKLKDMVCKLIFPLLTFIHGGAGLLHGIEMIDKNVYKTYQS